MSIFDKFFEAIAWLKIFLSPFIAGSIIAIILWVYKDNITFKILSIVFLVSGFLSGIYLAERIRRKVGTQEFISKLSETPDLDKDQ